MFDANLRHIGKDTRVFARIDAVRVDSPAWREGFRVGMVLPAQMLDDDIDNPDVAFRLNDDWIKVSNRDWDYGMWVSYEGNVDGTGFIDLDSLNKAMPYIRAEAIICALEEAAVSTKLDEIPFERLGAYHLGMTHLEVALQHYAAHLIKDDP